jgi:hypothetical protein
MLCPSGPPCSSHDRRPDHHPGAPAPTRPGDHQPAERWPRRQPHLALPYDGCSASPDASVAHHACIHHDLLLPRPLGWQQRRRLVQPDTRARARSCTRVAASSDGPVTASPPSTISGGSARSRPPPGTFLVAPDLGPGPRRAGPGARAGRGWRLGGAAFPASLTRRSPMIVPADGRPRGLRQFRSRQAPVPLGLSSDAVGGASAARSATPLMRRPGDPAVRVARRVDDSRHAPAARWLGLQCWWRASPSGDPQDTAYHQAALHAWAWLAATATARRLSKGAATGEYPS